MSIYYRMDHYLMKDAVDKSGGVMVALRLPIDEARTLAVEDGQPANDLHVTLAYLGDAADMTSEQLQLLHDICGAIAATEAPISGAIQGYGVFTKTDDGPCLYASYDSPDLPALRQTIMDALKGAGLPVHEDHGFTPHITLAYGESAPPGPVPSTPITFNGLTVTFGGTEAWMKFQGEPVEKYSEDQARDDHGRFAEMGRGGAHPAGSVQAKLGWEPTDDGDRARLGELLKMRDAAIERIGKEPGWEDAKSWEEMTPEDKTATRAAYVKEYGQDNAANWERYITTRANAALGEMPGRAHEFDMPDGGDPALRAKIEALPEWQAYKAERPGATFEVNGTDTAFQPGQPQSYPENMFVKIAVRDNSGQAPNIRDEMAAANTVMDRTYVASKIETVIREHLGYADHNDVRLWSEQKAGEHYDVLPASAGGATSKFTVAVDMDTVTRKPIAPPTDAILKELVKEGDEGVEAFSQKGKDLGRAKAWLNEVVVNRTAELAGITKAQAANIQRYMWEAWKGNSKNEGSLAMRGGAAAKLGAVENPDTLRSEAETHQPGSSTNGYRMLATKAGLVDADPAIEVASGKKIAAAAAQAQWEVTQYALAKAGIDHIDTYRAVVLPSKMVGNTVSLDSPGHPILLPDLALQRNALSSWTETAKVANDWEGIAPNTVDKEGRGMAGDTDIALERVVLRARIPAIGVFSIPAFGKNLHNEREVVALGTPVEVWDAFARQAPPISSHLSNFRITHEVGHIDDSGRSRFLKIGAKPKVKPLPIAASEDRSIDRPGGYVIDLDESQGHWLGASVEKFDESKHPRDKQGEFTESGGGSLPALADKVAEPVSRHERTNSAEQLEHGLVVGENGQVLLSKEGHHSGIEFSREEIESVTGKNAVMTHNHPEGRSLSLDDINFASTIGSTEMRAVSPQFVYRMQPGTAGWPVRILLKSWYQKTNQEVHDYYTKQLIDKKITTDEANMAHGHEVWTRLSKEHPEYLVYSREKL